MQAAFELAPDGRLADAAAALHLRATNGGGGLAGSKRVRYEGGYPLGEN